MKPMATRNTDRDAMSQAAQLAAAYATAIVIVLAIIGGAL